MLSREQEVTDLSKINTHIYQFYQDLSMEKQNVRGDLICDFLNELTVPLLTTRQLLNFLKNLIKIKDKIYISNWRSISLLNFDLKMISKSLATRVKKVLSNLNDASQTVYVNERFIGESSRLIDDVIKVCDIQKTSGYLLTLDFEKAFDSLNHNFLIAVLKKYGFGEDFVDWIKLFLRDQESCVINGGHTTTYFRLERGARQGDPISAYLLCLH